MLWNKNQTEMSCQQCKPYTSQPNPSTRAPMALGGKSLLSPLISGPGLRNPTLKPQRPPEARGSQREKSHGSLNCQSLLVPSCRPKLPTARYPDIGDLGPQGDVTVTVFRGWGFEGFRWAWLRFEVCRAHGLRRLGGDQSCRA